MAGLDIDVRDRSEQRKFGLVMAVAIAVLGMIRWGFHWLWSGHMPETLPYGFFAVAGVFLILGIVAPKALQPVFWLWIKLAIGINWLITRTVLSIVWFLMIVPGHAILALLGKDLMKRNWAPEAETYWEEPEEQPEEFDRYLNQF